MKFIKNLQIVSEILFFILGGLYLLAFVFLRNNIFVYQSQIFVRLADIPFALISIVYMLSSIRLSFVQQMLNEFSDEESDKLIKIPLLDRILIGVGLFLLLIIILVNFLWEDVS